MKGQWIIPWLHKAFDVINTINTEIQMHCPYCDHKSFYFNVSKQVGYCHAASCGKTPSLDGLIELKGYGPTDYGVEEEVEEKTEVKEELILPGNPLINPGGSPGDFLTNYPQAVAYLQSRNLKMRDMLRFGMSFDGARIYVPVYYNEVLENYVGRDITGMLDLKYKYCPGRKTSHFLFGWDEAQYWNHLTLVENTFVSIWLRNHFNCSTNFGSYLSDVQIDLIARSKVKRVILLWDENTGKRAEKCVNRLEKAGVEACYVEMKGQPDDHLLEELDEYWMRVNEERDNGRIRYDA